MNPQRCMMRCNVIRNEQLSVPFNVLHNNLGHGMCFWWLSVGFSVHRNHLSHGMCFGWLSVGFSVHRNHLAFVMLCADCFFLFYFYFFIRRKCLGYVMCCFCSVSVLVCYEQLSVPFSVFRNHLSYVWVPICSFQCKT